MSSSQSTCWTLILDAAAGKKREREAFAQRYAPVIRAYIAARWKDDDRIDDIEDACQEVFAECFQAGGPLDRVDRECPGGFRAFLYGIARNVVLRCEHRRYKRPAEHDIDLDQIDADETSLSKVFDRAWAVALMQEAADRQAEIAEQTGPNAMRRVELLRLRFREELPIREIARRWQVEASSLHHEYATARQEFKTALKNVVAQHQPDYSAGEIDGECREFMSLIGD